MISSNSTNLSTISEEIYSRDSSAVAFQAVAQAMAFGSTEQLSFENYVDQLGPNRVRKAALAAAFLSSFSETTNRLIFDYERYKKRCLLNAFLLESIAQGLDADISTDSFAAGLLMDASYLLLLEFFESDLELSLYTLQNNPDISVLQAEIMNIGISHNDVSAELAKEINLGSQACEALRFHHNPSDCESKFTRSADICHVVSVLADRLSYRIAPGTKSQQFDPLTIPRLSLPQDFVINITDGVEFATEIAEKAVDNATAAITNVRRFGT